MTRQPTTIARDATIAQAQRLLRRGGMHHLPVVDADAVLVGVLSHTDFYRAGIEPDESVEDDGLDDSLSVAHLTVDQLMRSEPVSVRSDDPVRMAIAILAAGAFHALPVVDDAMHVVGILTTSDVLRRLIAE